jgi:hypothetical protein
MTNPARLFSPSSARATTVASSRSTQSPRYVARLHEPVGMRLSKSRRCAVQCNTTEALLYGGSGRACEVAECNDTTWQRANLSEAMVTRYGQSLQASGVWAVASGRSYVPYTATCIPQAGQVLGRWLRLAAFRRSLLRLDAYLCTLQVVLEFANCSAQYQVYSGKVLGCAPQSYVLIAQGSCQYYGYRCLPAPPPPPSQSPHPPLPHSPHSHIGELARCCIGDCHPLSSAQRRHWRSCLMT